MKKILQYITSAVLWVIFGFSFFNIIDNYDNTLSEICFSLYFLMSSGIFSLIMWFICDKKKNSTLVDKIVYPINAFIFPFFAYYIYLLSFRL